MLDIYNMQDIYNKKYLKYKAKYLELKGGTPPKFVEPEWTTNLKKLLIKNEDPNGMTYDELNKNLEIFKNFEQGKYKLYYYDKDTFNKRFEIISVVEKGSTLTITWEKMKEDKNIKKDFNGTVLEEKKDEKKSFLSSLFAKKKVIYPIIIDLGFYHRQKTGYWDFILEEIKTKTD